MRPADPGERPCGLRPGPGALERIKGHLSNCASLEDATIGCGLSIRFPWRNARSVCPSDAPSCVYSRAGPVIFWPSTGALDDQVTENQQHCARPLARARAGAGSRRSSRARRGPASRSSSTRSACFSASGPRPSSSGRERTAPWSRPSSSCRGAAAAPRRRGPAVRRRRDRDPPRDPGGRQGPGDGERRPGSREPAARPRPVASPSSTASTSRRASWTRRPTSPRSMPMRGLDGELGRSAEFFRRVREAEAALERLRSDRREAERRREMLEFQAAEIEKAGARAAARRSRCAREGACRRTPAGWPSLAARPTRSSTRTRAPSSAASGQVYKRVDELAAIDPAFRADAEGKRGAAGAARRPGPAPARLPGEARGQPGPRRRDRVPPRDDRAA